MAHQPTGSGMYVAKTAGVRGGSGRKTENKTEDVKPPAHDALKAEWVAYADSLGIGTVDMTKQEIIDAVEAHTS